MAFADTLKACAFIMANLADQPTTGQNGAQQINQEQEKTPEACSIQEGLE